MTEEEWVTSVNNPAVMLDHLRGLSKHFQPSDRKYRLIAVACARNVLPFVRYTDRKSFEDLLSVAERFAEGAVPEGELLAAYRGTRTPTWEVKLAQHACLSDARDAARSVVTSAGKFVGQKARKGKEGKKSELQLQSCLIRCILGDPFHRVAVDAAWLTSTVVGLAHGIYDDQAFDRLPILADALQDAGCEDADLLTHCRGSGPHVRGCWVVDLLTGRT